MKPDASTLTDQQKIARLAAFMRWTLKTYSSGLREWRLNDEFIAYYGEGLGWNPLTDWNHWRMVEEKVMEDERLWQQFMDSFRPFALLEYMKADLPTRVDALLSVLPQA